MEASVSPISSTNGTLVAMKLARIRYLIMEQTSNKMKAYESASRVLDVLCLRVY
jgi:hypothetical protein